VNKAGKICLPWQRLLRYRNTKLRSFIHSSANPDNLVKSGPVAFEIIVMRKIESLKNKKTDADCIARHASLLS